MNFLLIVQNIIQDKKISAKDILEEAVFKITRELLKKSGIHGAKESSFNCWTEPLLILNLLIEEICDRITEADKACRTFVDIHFSNR